MKRKNALGTSLIAVLLTFSGQLAAQGRPILRDAPTKLQPPADDPAVVRSRLVTVDFKALTARLSKPEKGTGARHVRLELFPDVVISARLQDTTLRNQRYNSWAGSAEGIEGSQVVLVSGGGVLMGSVRTPTEAYRIRLVGAGGVHVVEQVDTALYPQEREGEWKPIAETEAEASGGREDGGVPEKLLDDGSTLDLLVVYTPAARAAAGGTTAIQNLIALGVTETNSAYANSNVVPRLNLVGTQEVTYTESGNIQTDVNRLQGKTDGFMDSVHALRDSLKADLVMLVGESTAGGCGIAYNIMSGTNNRAFESQAFSYTARTCISPNYSFGHELGHLQGSNHAPGDPTGTGAYSYSFGYKDPNRVFRTMMAYDCSGGSCPRVLQFSNPNVTYSGLTTGSTTQNNAASITNTRSVVGNFRQAASQTICSGTSGGYQGCRGNGCAVCAEKVAAYPLYYFNHPLCAINYTCASTYYECSSNCPAPAATDLCNGTPGGWDGCRGNGCAVCEELVAGYTRYFINHPACTRNFTCAGFATTCNANCPAPTPADL